MRLGIDFGTCFTSAAFLDGETLTTVKDPLTGSFSLPSTVLYTRNGKLLVGNQANYQRMRYPDRFRGELKRVIGQSTPVMLGDTAFPVLDLVAAIVEKVKNDANGIVQGMGKSAFIEAILTVPAIYQGFLQEQVRNAASKAGFPAENVTLLTEPVAAAYYYASKNVIQAGETVLVYDLGGGTFDTALLKKTGATFVHLASPAGFSDHGGLDFDRVIYLDLMNKHTALRELLNGGRTDTIAIQAQSIIGDQCVLLKHQLSDSDEAWLSYVVPGTGALLEYALERTDFETMIAPIVQGTINCCQHVIEQASMTSTQISHILLVGGSCRIPFIRRELQRAFNRPIITAPDLELVVCQGAAIYGRSLDMPVIKQAQSASSKPREITVLKRTRPLPRLKYSTSGRPNMLEHIKIAVLGASSSGRASMMLAMYGMMREGIAGFNLNAIDTTEDFELIEKWDRLVDGHNDRYDHWPAPTSTTNVYTFDFCYKEQGLISFDWLSSRGSIFKGFHSSEDYQYLQAYLQKSAGILLCIPGDLLKTSIRGREVSVRAKIASDRINAIINATISEMHAAFHPAIVILITKFDLLIGRNTEEIISEIKELFSPFFAPAGGWSVAICPVSLGSDLSGMPPVGEINPINIHRPLAFFARNVLLDESKRQDNSRYTWSSSSYDKALEAIEQLLGDGFIYYEGGQERQISSSTGQIKQDQSPIKRNWFNAPDPPSNQPGKRDWFSSPDPPPSNQLGKRKRDWFGASDTSSNQSAGE